MFRFLSLVLPVLALGAVALLLNRVAAADVTTGPTTGSVTVTVHDKAKAAVTGAHVVILPAPAKKAAAGTIEFAKKDAPAPIAEGDTAADGTVTLNNIPVGDYIAQVTKDKEKGTSKKFTIAAGTTASTTVILAAPKPKPPPAAGN